MGAYWKPLKKYILETIEAFNVVRNAYKVARLSNFEFC